MTTSEGGYRFPSAPDIEASYFELQAYTGATKHLGGFEATQKLIEICGISKNTHVLEVGCGVGATACYLARDFGCHVTGVDVRPGMITRSKERAARLGVEGTVDFRAADALDLPFEDGFFDVVFCESVGTFIEDKSEMVRQCARVVAPGGPVGLNEQVWLKPPPAHMVEEVRRLWAVEPEIPAVAGWQGILEGAGLRDIVVESYEFEARREASQVRRYGLGDYGRMAYRTLALLVKNPGFRAYMKGRQRLPKSVFEYLGYALFVGRKTGPSSTDRA